MKEDEMTKDEAFREYERALIKIDKQVRKATEEALAILRDHLATISNYPKRSIKKGTNENRA